MCEFQFQRHLLRPETRKDGVSAFMRIRNGAEFLRAAVLSHLPFFDEIVAVFNRCSDDTPQILAELAREYPGTIKVYEYKPRVYPVGSVDHQRTPADSLHSMVNYYNFALSKTSCKIATKLDDDHLAIPRAFKQATDRIRKEGLKDELRYYSGINLLRDQVSAGMGVLKDDPLSGGGGDICFFPVSENTLFEHNPRYEVFRPRVKTKSYAGILYYHLKYLKSDHGFSNYELDDYPESEYLPMLRFLKEEAECEPFASFAENFPRRMWTRNIAKQLISRLARRFVPRAFYEERLLFGSMCLTSWLRAREDMRGLPSPDELIADSVVPGTGD